MIELKEQLRNEQYEINGELHPINKGVKVVYENSKALDKEYVRDNAAFVSLVRNEDMVQISETIRSFEDRFNKKFNYPWVFMNNNDFTPDFKRQISNIVSGEVEFVKIPDEFWSVPNFINKDTAKQNRIKSRTKMPYGGSENYRFMCRFFSGFFYKLKELDKYDYVWRVEPDTKLHCDVNYDVFKFMKENNKQYGFAITLREFPATIETLWKNVLKFIELYPSYLHQNNLISWLSEDQGRNYNLCHFWTNFEIVNLNFYRSEAYGTYFDFLDKQKGFFYERWGDAPVHSIAVSLFLDKNQVHFFNDIGYVHPFAHNCPIDDEIWKKNKCLCDQNLDVTFRDFSCTRKFYDVTDLEKPFGWQDHTGGINQ